MSKTNGLGDNFYIGGYDLSGDVASLDQIGGGPAAGDVTGIKSSAHERIGLLRDGRMQFTSFFRGHGDWSPSLVGSAALSALPTSDTIAMYFRGTALQNPAAAINGKQVNYDPTRDNNGNLTLKVDVQANGFGLEMNGEQLTAGLRTDTTATIGPAIDDGSGSTFGGQAYFMLTAFTGTSVTIDIQSCTTSGGTYATTGLTSSALTAIGGQRVAVANTTTINEFIKVVTTGTFTNAVFAVVFVRNPIAGVVF
jgi:hypothetical protein